MGLVGDAEGCWHRDVSEFGIAMPASGHLLGRRPRRRPRDFASRSSDMVLARMCEAVAQARTLSCRVVSAGEDRGDRWRFALRLCSGSCREVCEGWCTRAGLMDVPRDASNDVHDAPAMGTCRNDGDLDRRVGCRSRRDLRFDLFAEAFDERPAQCEVGRARLVVR